MTSVASRGVPGHEQRMVRREVRTGSGVLKPPLRSHAHMPCAQATGDARAVRWLDGTTSQRPLC